jgi:hypothetical protein
MISEQVLTRAGMNRACVSDVRAGNAFEFEPETFRRCFNRKPFVVRHHLADHPLFRLPRLIELARSLPQQFVEYNAGNIPVSIDSRLTPGNGLSVEETIRRIEGHCSWMVLKRVEHDPEYNELLRRCLDEVESLSEPLDPGMYNRAGSVFISSPGSVTPYHIDHEYNFLLQIRGQKTLSVFDGGDRSILAEEELENHFSGPGLHRNLVFKEEYQRAATVFDLTPGEALHVPATAPHWVKNGPEVSISFSVNFYTSATDRNRGVHNINSRLRRLGIKPAPVGRSAARDSIKYGAFRALRRASSLLGRSSD